MQSAMVKSNNIQEERRIKEAGMMVQCLPFQMYQSPHDSARPFGVALQTSKSTLSDRMLLSRD